LQFVVLGHIEIELGRPCMRSSVATAILTASVACWAGQDQPRLEKEPDAITIETICEKDPDPSDCSKRLKKAIETPEKPIDTGATLFVVVGLAAPVLVWLLMKWK
jgi:hypothetical protein